MTLLLGTVYTTISSAKRIFGSWRFDSWEPNREADLGPRRRKRMGLTQEQRKTLHESQDEEGGMPDSRRYPLAAEDEEKSANALASGGHARIGGRTGERSMLSQGECWCLVGEARRRLQGRAVQGGVIWLEELTNVKPPCFLRELCARSSLYSTFSAMILW